MAPGISLDRLPQVQCVSRWIRVRIGNVKLGRLKPGQWRNLTDAELRGLLPQRVDW